MASPENRHCANCIGTLSFPIIDASRVAYRITEQGLCIGRTSVCLFVPSIDSSNGCRLVCC